MTDPRIAALRKLARSHGWTVSTVTRARGRAPIALLATRVVREPWSPRNMSQHAVTERVEVNVDTFGDAVTTSRAFVQRGYQNRISTPPALAHLDRTPALAEHYLTAEPS